MNDFNKYLQAKLCLYKMVGQFLNTYITESFAKDNNIEVDNEHFKIKNCFEVCFHNYTSMGILAWNYLGLTKDYITYDELFDLEFTISNEEYNEENDYYVEYLKIAILLIDMVKKYYAISIPYEENKDRLSFDEDYDVVNNKIDACDHMFESAGECVWNLFDIEDVIVGESVFELKRNTLCIELLKRQKTSNKQLIKMKTYKGAIWI